MKFYFLTLFPDAIDVWLKTSIPGRAQKAGLFDYEMVNLRDYGNGPHQQVDDMPYGGGGGMLMALPPLVSAWEKITEPLQSESFRTIYFSPAGRPLNHALLQECHARTAVEHYLLICGHYEGVDQRFIDYWVDDEISLGDFVLTGGELPAVAFVDAFIRGLDGTLGGREVVESFALKDPQTQSPLLEYPQYTRPAEFRDLVVPDVLLSGDHARVAEWRREQSMQLTRQKRPDLGPPRY